MAITYQKTPLEWKNEGAEPSNALKTGGFEPGMKPTADAFNYFWHNAGEVEKELQSKLSAEATARETADTTLQNNINKKQATITGAATTVTSSNLTTNRALISNSSGKIAVSDITSTELGYLDGTTSNIQTQLNNVNTKAESFNTEANTRIDNLRPGVTNLFLNSADYSGDMWHKEAAVLDGSVYNGAKIYKVNTKWFGYKYYVANLLSRNIIKLGDVLTCSCYAKTDNPTGIELSFFAPGVYGTDLAPTTGEWQRFTYTFTVTETFMAATDSIRDNSIRFEPETSCDTGCYVYFSNLMLTKGNMIVDWSPAPEDIEEKINSNTESIAGLQAALSSETTERETADTTLQNNINKKQATITGAATTVTSSNLTTNRALISNSSGKIAVSAITDTELGYLDGTTSNVQTQLNNVNKSISSEATARETADNTLQGKINTEETARKAKDNALQNQLNEKTGYDMSGQAVYTLGADIVAVAGTNAELLNDYRTRTFGEESFFDGGTVPTSGNVASGSYSTAAGQCTTAIGGNSFAIGNETVASGLNSFASGGRTHALGEASHAEGGGGSSAEGLCSHAEGGSTQALEDYSHSEGYATVAHRYQHAQGRCNKVSHGAASATDMTGDLFIVGNGTLENRGNALRTATEGRTYGLASFLASGADYAEMWEYADGNPKNEDRRGYFVTVDENNKIHIANAEDDYILGVISACPVVVGDIQSEMWKDMYLTDIYGNKLTETVEVPETIDEKTGTIIPAHTETRWILNPDYDPEQEYICREDRPEWDAVGLLGKLIVNDDGTAKVGGFCKVANGGIATNSEDKSGWRVLERLDDKHIKILYR